MQIVHGKGIVLPNYDFSETYWPVMSGIAEKQLPEEEKEPEKVVLILKDCFSALCDIFSKKINEQTNASFFIFCKNIHENSIELWRMQLKKIPLGINEEDFAVSRRVLKIILEQSTKLSLKGAIDFKSEILENEKKYAKILEELLYIGTWSILFSEYIARSQVFPNSIGLKMENGKLNILTYEPFAKLYKFIFSEFPKHDENVVLSDSIHEFKEILTNNLKVSYDILGSFIIQQLNIPNYEYSIMKIDDLIYTLVEDVKYSKEFLEDFYKGLTVSKENALTIEECILKNQDLNRYSYRPILEMSIDNKKYNLIGTNKWLESLSLLTTNAFPFGLYPREWMVYEVIRKFVIRIDNTHDSVLEEPICKLLKERKVPYDFNVESFVKKKGDNINIKQTIGDIDILFIDEATKSIFVCECKHNRSRFDMNNWKRDYSNFKNKYEAQLTRKVNWITENKVLVESHFQNKIGYKLNHSIEEYITIGIFVINAPSIYMFNGIFDALTISDIKRLLDKNYSKPIFTFNNTFTGEITSIENPFYDNIISLNIEH